MTAMDESCPVDCALAFCLIWGNLKNTERKGEREFGGTA